MFLKPLQTGIYYTAVISVCIFGVMLSATKRILYASDPEKWDLPFLPISWINFRRSPIFEMVCFCQLFSRMLFAIIVSSFDSLVASFVAHLSTQCQMLQCTIRNMIPNAKVEVGEKDCVSVLR